MTSRRFVTPRREDLGLRSVRGGAGVVISALPDGCLFAIEQERPGGRVLVSQILGSAFDGGVGRLLLRVGGAGRRRLVAAVGPGARGAFGAAEDRFAWTGAEAGIRHETELWAHPSLPLWFWRVRVVNAGAAELVCDATLIQDLGLGAPGFVMGNEAFASQYIDHHVARHPRFGPVVMSRQNLEQGGTHPWIAQGCVEGAAGFATDAGQVFGPGYRDTGALDPEAELPNVGLQHEMACATIRSGAVTLAPGAEAGWTFFAAFEPDHPAASGAADLARLDAVAAALADHAPRAVATGPTRRGLFREAASIAGEPFDAAEIAARYPARRLVEGPEAAPLSFFVAGPEPARHVVLRAKDRLLARRHGAIPRTGQGMLPDATTMCATVFMHGVFGALLSLGNTSFHRLFSASRDPYDVTRAGGLRILIETGGGWRLLGEPSGFEMGLNDCRWIYRLGERVVTVHLVASGTDPAMSWSLAVEGPPARFLVVGGLVLGEREYEQAGRVEIDAGARRVTFRPDLGSLWGGRYPEAVYHLVTDTPEAVAALGGEELLRADTGAGEDPPATSAAVVIATRPARAFRFTVVGALDDPGEAERLAARHAGGVEAAAGIAAGAEYWRRVTREARLIGDGPGVAALNAALPWLAQNAMVHLTVPHGLEQSGGAAWGTRDVCQGPVEFLLAFEHDAVVREILARVFAEQHETRGDWPQWFMPEPYAGIRDPHSHGDVIIWPLKALCDYLEATDDLGFLDAPVAWWRAEGGRSAERAPVSAHVAKLIATVQGQFIPGTRLVRYGEGDWNDSLQPADPALRDRMVSAWTVALLYEQLTRYAEILTRAGRAGEGAELSGLAAEIRADFNRHLIRDGVVAGYAVFAPEGGAPELLLHPDDTRTGLRYSLLPMTQGIIGGIFDADQARRHLELIRAHLLFPDGARLMDRPVAYHGGPERLFRRAESAAFFGREIGLMYVHAHLRYGEAEARFGAADALWRALMVANPVAVAEAVPNAAPRQRNAYFSSSDAAFPDRHAASADWARVREGAVSVEGGWRIYSSGPGLYTNLLLRHALGLRRRFGARTVAPVLPAGTGPLAFEWVIDGRRERWDLTPG